MIMSNNLGKVHVYLYGKNHSLKIDGEVVFKKGKIWYEDDSCEIRIKRKTTIEDCELAAVENGSRIEIGEDCMLSSGIRIATSDSHSVIDLLTQKRINTAGNIIIGNHVWIGANSAINKGVTIGDNSILGGHSVLTKSIPQNVIAAGIPAIVVKSGITWNRKRI